MTLGRLADNIGQTSVEVDMLGGDTNIVHDRRQARRDRVDKQLKQTMIDTTDQVNRLMASSQHQYNRTHWCPRLWRTHIQHKRRRVFCVVWLISSLYRPPEPGQFALVEQQESREEGVAVEVLGNFVPVMVTCEAQFLIVSWNNPRVINVCIVANGHQPAHNNWSSLEYQRKSRQGDFLTHRHKAIAVLPVGQFHFRLRVRGIFIISELRPCHDVESGASALFFKLSLGSSHADLSCS